MSRFWNYLKTQPDEPTSGSLPLVHSTDLLAFRGILSNGELRPRSCKVYTGENLLYFFYGRPSYRANAKLNTTDARAFLPICLIMDQRIAGNCVRVMPFDSGAFHQQRMHPPMHPDMQKEDFELLANPAAPMKLISTFYASEQDYFDTKPKPMNEILYDEYDDLEVDSYARLLRNRSNSLPDDRVSAVEIQINGPVSLQGQVKAVVLPKQYLDKPGILAQVDSWGATAIPYYIQNEYVPSQAHSAIVERIHDYYVQEGLLS